MEISNNLARRRLQAKLNSDFKLSMYFKNIAKCGTTNVNGNGIILARRVDKPDAKFIGLNHCANAWLCPNCAPRAAAMQARNIAAALDVAEQQNLKAFMMTLTIGHFKNIPCKITFEVLFKLFNRFFSNLNSKTGCLKFIKDFHQDVQIKHFIRACEVTWGVDFGWHPHFHVLFFVPTENFDKVLKWEEILADNWRNYAQKYLIKCIENQETDENIKQKQIKVINTIYEKRRENTVGLYISKNENNQIIQQKSSNYLAGWGGNNELTGLEVKTAKLENHYTPLQILDLAIKSDEAKEEKNVWWDLFFDIAYAVYKKRTRWGWSHTGLKKMALDYLNSLSALEIKKKYSNGGAPNAEWQTVAFIPSSIYEELYKQNNYFEIEKLLLQYAINDDFEMICELFKKYRLPEPLRNFCGEIKGLRKAA